jgi:hypothetical protein
MLRVAGCRPRAPKPPRLLTRCLPEPKPAFAEIQDVPEFIGRATADEDGYYSFAVTL